MNDRDSRGSGSTAAIIAVIVVILLAVPCLLAVLLFGAGIFVYHATEKPNTQLEQVIDEPAATPIAPPLPVGAEADKSE